MAENNGSLLITVRSPPYSHGGSRSPVELALASAAFEHPVSVLFMGEGVLQLLPEQDSKNIGRRNIARLLASLPLYDIASVYVDAAAAADYCVNIENAPVNSVALPGGAMRELMLAHDHLLNF